MKLKLPIKCACSTCGGKFMRYRNRGSMTVCPPCQNKVRVSEWKRNNPERKRALNAKWIAENPEKNRQIKADWAKRNPENGRIKQRVRGSRVRQATPAWADRQAMVRLYKATERITRVTGIEHNVDHVIPLRGSNVCGLHIHTNMRIIAANQNKSKGNKFLFDLAEGNA